ncbi:annexin A6-like isoform X1 [Brachionus plicatilis]|uniref:Annexin A6-like isoform X1 n=1 Tax=Brachionus plicatilis TaxID=10195 RepID=A0A3M7SGF7_BRAPC|nr:annexin A6-like isoform X1 [Brachionus plicatilis]
MSLKLDPFLVCNRLVKEEWENREYELHLKRLNEIKNRKTKVETIRFPIILNNSKKAQLDQENQNDIDRNAFYTEKKIRKINSQKNPDIWNPEYEKRKIRDMNRNRGITSLETENQRIAKKIKNAKGVYSIKKWDEDFENHMRYLKFSEKKFYTPRGMGHRKLKSLPDMKYERTNYTQKNKNTLKMLNQAVNQQDRGDVVLMKTLVQLNYYERMETKKNYEETYQSDLKKGLIKVMEKQYEPLINALLTDNNSVDIDKIYESLYEPSEAAVVITEAIISRNSEDRESLLAAFESKIDSSLSSEIENKLEGELKLFLLNFIQNQNLNKEKCDEKQAESYAKTLETNFSYTSDEFLEIFKSSSKKELNIFFKSFQKIHGEDVCKEADMYKPICKSIKFIQTFLNNPILYKTEKIQKTFKANKPEFLRLLAIQSNKDLDEIVKTYNKRTNIDTDIKNAFSEDVARLILKMVHKNSDE